MMLLLHKSRCVEINRVEANVLVRVDVVVLCCVVLCLKDGECGRPDSIIAAESWKLFSMRDRSVLVESLYGQFKSTIECGQCGKVCARV